MRSYFRAVAIDYDGTLTVGERPTEAVLAALAAARAGNRRLILVTGRILVELRAVFPDCADHFDLIVAENGAVIAASGLTMPLAMPLPEALDDALTAAGVDFRRGAVILATSARYEVAVLQALQRHAADANLVRNRGELMVVPGGVSKAGGLRHALLQLGISPHSAIAVGDAENDLAMFDICEIGVAVGNAVESVRTRADLILPEADGSGVVSLLRRLDDDRLLLGGQQRWQVSLGRSPTGAPISLPAAGVDVLIAGGTGSGKSFVAGLIAEQLIRLGYVICVLDPEGDHGPLGRLPNAVTLGGRDRLPAPEDLAQLFEQSGTSVVVDQALVAPAQRAAWTAHAIRFLERRRATTGLPHWLVIDEAHYSLDRGGDVVRIDPRLKGHCLVTYRPDHLAGTVCRDADYALLVAGHNDAHAACGPALAAALHLPGEALATHAAALQAGEALLVRINGGPAFERVRFAPRWVSHVRHWHKYTSAHLPIERRFHFRATAGPTGALAGNLEEFHHELRRASLATLRHHASGGDLARWIADVIQDRVLADALRDCEGRLCRATDDGAAERIRCEALAAIERRYAAPGGWPPPRR